MFLLTKTWVSDINIQHPIRNLTSQSITIITTATTFTTLFTTFLLPKSLHNCPALAAGRSLVDQLLQTHSSRIKSLGAAPLTHALHLLQLALQVAELAISRPGRRSDRCLGCRGCGGKGFLWREGDGGSGGDFGAAYCRCLRCAFRGEGELGW